MRLLFRINYISIVRGQINCCRTTDMSQQEIFAQHQNLVVHMFSIMFVCMCQCKAICILYRPFIESNCKTCIVSSLYWERGLQIGQPKWCEYYRFWWLSLSLSLSNRNSISSSLQQHRRIFGETQNETAHEKPLWSFLNGDIEEKSFRHSCSRNMVLIGTYYTDTSHKIGSSTVNIVSLG